MFAKRNRWKGAALGVGLLAGVATSSALAGSNVVAPSRLSDTIYAKHVSQFLPFGCPYLGVTTIIVGVDGGSTSDLLLGGPSRQSFRGNGGNDCILGGAGDDNLRGDGGTDICYGGPGNDSFHPSCEYEVQ